MAAIEFDLFSEGIVTMQKRTTTKSCSVCGYIPQKDDTFAGALVRRKNRDVCEHCARDHDKGLPWVVDDDEE